MTTAVTTAEERTTAHEAHHDLGFLRTYVFSTDHKVIAKQFLILGLASLVIGGGLAALVRWQLGFPGQALPFIGSLLPETMAPGGIILPEFYNSLVTMHATFMIFFAVMPLTAGVFGNFLIPLQIRRAGHGVSPPQHAVVLVERAGAHPDGGELLRGGRCRRRWMDVVRAALGERRVHGRLYGPNPVARVVDRARVQLPHRRRELRHRP